MKTDVRRITDGAMMAALIGMLLLINRQTGGLIEATFLWILPLPMVFYSAKYGWKQSLVLFIAIVLLTLMLGSLQTIFYVSTETLIGYVYGSGIYAHSKTTKLVIRTILLACIADILSALVFASFFGYDLHAEVQEYTNIMQQVMQQGNMDTSLIDMKSMIQTTIVVSVVLMGVMEGLITHLLSRLMLKRLRIFVEPITPLSDFYPPVYSGYIGLVGALMFYYCAYHPFENEMIQRCMQGFGIAGVLYLVIFGMIAITLYLRITFHMKTAAVLIAVLLGMIASMVVLAIGFLYIATDIHSRIVQKGEPYAHKDS